MKRILDLTNVEARDFLLKKTSYVNFDLPSYVDFIPVLGAISKAIGNQTQDQIVQPGPSKNDKPLRPAQFDNVNYVLLNNKDGKYAWRPFSLIHPALYVLLVNELTSKENWKDLQTRFQCFHSNPKILCLGIPLVSESQQSDKAEQVSEWWKNVEQKSIALGLEFNYIAHTDISECFSSIYSHSIAWAVHDKAFAKQNRSDNGLLGNKIDRFLQSMSNGQTNGIPQGSTLTDFISEILLGYADMRLTERINELSIDDYRILRYRDDYRIFVNNPGDADAILKAITDILNELGHRLNPHKTFLSDNVVRDSVKPDKLYWASNGKIAKNPREHLQIIHGFAEKFPNSGTLKKLLTKYNDRIKNLQGKPENLFAMSSIVIDIAQKNPNTVPYCAAILSRFIALMNSVADKERVLNGLNRKFKSIPNTGLLQLWIQRITLKSGLRGSHSEKLCRKIEDSEFILWNSDWLQPSYRPIIDSASIVDQKKLDELDMIIGPDEIDLFVSTSRYD